MRKETSILLVQSYLQHFGINEMFPKSVLPYLELHYYKPREYVTVVDHVPQYFSICVEGKMKVMPSSEEGKVVLLDYVQPPSLLGDIELFCHLKFLHSVMAITPVVTLSIPKRVFYKEMLKNRFFLQFLCENLSNKLYVSSMNYSRAMLYPVKSRLSHYILQLSDEFASNEISIKMNETAQYLGITDRHLRRILNEFEDKGMIKQTYQKISVTEKELLEIEALTL